MGQSPLITRSETTPVAWLTRYPGTGTPTPDDGFAISPGVFLQHVLALAEQLPPEQHFINLCSNRYLFLVSLCACLVRGKISLLPQNRLPATQSLLAGEYPETALLHDGLHSLADDLPAFDVTTLVFDLQQADTDFDTSAIPQIDDEQLAILCFTSGSTGKPKPVKKYWKTLRESSLINARYMIHSEHLTGVYHYASVPCHHMWGLETTIFLPLFTNVCTVDASAELPADILDNLDRLPRPLTFVGTPLHLRALNTAAGQRIGKPQIDQVLCATAPLDSGLANELEEQLNTCVTEIYGCSEAGSLAVRRTATTQLWTPFEGIQFSREKSGQTAVNAGHLPGQVLLEDEISFIDQHHFRLTGRPTDMIKIAGKRSSLAAINQILLRYDGLNDGVIFVPEGDSATPRLAALVVANNKGSKTSLLNFLREHLDPVFLPRPVYFVDALPRAESGKLPRDSLLELFRQQRA